MTPTYTSSYGMIEQISELQDELHNLQHELENVLPRDALMNCEFLHVNALATSLPFLNFLVVFSALDISPNMYTNQEDKCVSVQGAQLTE
jgi:hypothetical protein